MGNLVDKYLNKKKKDILSYSKIIDDMLKYDANQLWKSEAEFNEYLKSTILHYVDNYYFDTLKDFEQYKEFFGPLIKCDDRFKTILVCAVNSLKVQFESNNKASVYLIALIVYTSVIVDRFTYPYNNYSINMKNVLSIITPMFNSVSFVKFEESHKLIKELTKLVKKNDLIENKFFSSINELNNENSKNEYELVDENGKYYKVLYKYKIEKIEDYTEREIKKSFKRISDDLILLSFELATLSSLKIKMKSLNIKLLFPVNLEFYSKDSEISKLMSVTNNKEILKNIVLLINYNDYKKYKDIAKSLKSAGFELAFNIEEASTVPYTAFVDTNIVFISNEFINVNKTNIDTWRETGIEFNIKKKNEIISELEMLGIKEE